MFKKLFSMGVIATCLSFMACGPATAQFVHPGCLSTQADLVRMKAKVDASAQPWKGGYDRLLAAPYGQLGHTPDPRSIVYVDSSEGQNNYIVLARDAAAAYQTALRYHVSGDPQYAAKSVSILMAWANTHTSWSGNTNVSLRAGLYGYQLACAGELVRNYSGWAPADFATFQNYIRNQFYHIVSPNNVDQGFLYHHHGTCWSHYWANWELAAMATVIATGVLCDDPVIFQEAIDYFHDGVGVGRITEMLHYLHPNGLGQSQEFGRDQGHATMLGPLLGSFCEIAWNQGVDLYGELDNAFLALNENLAKYNLSYDVPYVPYINCEYVVQTNIGSGQTMRAGWDLIYNHYVNRRGMSAPYSKEAAEQMRPDGGGGQYGTDSGGFDQLGFTTLTHMLDPITTGVVPSKLRAHVKGGKVTLSWRGSAYAKSYNVKRATTSGGPYVNVATVGYKNTYFMDAGVSPGTTYYYVVSANNPGSESANSAEISAEHDGQLYGTVIGTDGSAGNWGATKGLAMDGSLKNYMDAWAANGGWVGLDLGADVSAVVTELKYCPQPGGGNRLVGGVFEGSNTADFSTGVVNLFTVTTAPPSGVFTSQSISNGTAFRYIRFRAPTNTYCTLAEVQFIGNVTGMTPPAAAPTGLAVSSPGEGQASLNWNSVAGATDYVIKRSLTPGGPYTVVEYSSSWDTNYTDRKLAAGTYYYVVSAINSVGETANSAEQSIQVLINTAPGSITSAHLAGGAGNEGSDKVVDRNVNTKWFSGANTSSSGWLQVDLGAGNGQIVTRYDLTSANDVPNRDPKNWQLLASNDAVNWTTLDSRTGETFATRFLTKQYTFTNTTAYRYYKLNILSNFSGSAVDGIQLAEWALISQGVELPSPGGLAATAVSFSSINLTWNAVDGASSYTVKRSTTSGGPYTTVASGITATNWLNSGLSASTTYYYVVSAINAGGESANSEQASANTDIRVNLAFNESSGTTAADTSGLGYNGTLVNGPVFSTGTVGNAVNLDGTNDHVTLPSGVVSGMTAFTASVWVKPDTVTNWARVFDFGTGINVYMFLAPQNPGNGKVRFAITTTGWPGEQKIDGQSALAAGIWSHVVVTWSGNTGILYVNGVEVGRNSAMTLNPSSLGTTTQNYLGRSQFADPYFDGLIDDFRIYTRALSPTEIANQTLAQMPDPATVTGLTATAGDTQVSLGWTAVPGATGYAVKRSTASGGPYFTVAANVTSTTFTDTGLTNGITYHYVVCAKNVGGVGANSSQASAMPVPPPPATPTGLAVTVDSASRINLTWSASSGATGYNVKRATVSGGPYTTVATSIGSTSFTDTGLSASTTYYYVVSAVNLGGESANSSQASGTTQPGAGSLPSGWSGGDIGTVGIAGSAGFAGGTYTVTGSGADIWGTADEFQFVSRQIIGDCDIIARVASVENTDPWAKAGVMIRESLNASSTHATMVVSSANGLAFQRRTSTGGTSLNTSVPAITAPHWVRLVRSGNTFTAYRSTDGAAWTTVGSQTITMTSGVYVGLAVTSHNNTALATATFDNVSIVTLPSPWASADVGAVAAAGASYYSAGTFTIDGSGADFWGTADEFHYAYQTATGDCEIVARVTAVENTDPWAKVGVMIRESTSANSTHAAMAVTPASGLAFQRRTSTGGSSLNTSVGAITAPQWVRLVRSGNTFTAYHSADGTSWTTVGSQTITMATSVSIGIAVTSHNDGVLCTGTVDNVTVTP
jgi:fibronectin type 3 domain-containing protein/regulation of enolase protein 1 (concanavalin A-like superfamily)